MFNSMMKSDIDIKDEVYSILINSNLKNAITGSIYKDSKRPSYSKDEDIVISVISSLNGEFQDVVVNVNLYVADVMRGNDSIENSRRLRVLCRECINLLSIVSGEDYRIQLLEQRIYEVPSTREHCINNKLSFTQITF